MRSLLLAVLTAAALFSQQAQSPAKAIDDRIIKLRSLPDDARAVETKKLALEIRAVPDPEDELALAFNLSTFATEGDFGRDTLHEVASTLVDGLHKVHSAPQVDWDEIARLEHFEGADIKLTDPKFLKAMAALDETDRVRANSDFSLKDLKEKTWTLKQLRGHVVLVNFWATWCPPCRKEMPDLEVLHNRFRNKGLVILAISDEEDSKVRPFIGEQKYTYPVLLDPGRSVNDRFLIQGIPKSLVYDREGKLVAQSSDMRTMGQFLEMLKRAGLN